MAAARRERTVTASVVDARKDRNRQHLALLARWCATVFAVPALLVAVLVAVIARQLLVGILLGVVVYAVVSLLVFAHVRRFGSSVVAALGGEEPVESESKGDGAATVARLYNLLDGLCLANGVARPRVLVLPAAGANAATVAVTDGAREIVLVLTRPVIEDLARIELEGLLAQQLGHVRDGDTALSTFVAAVASVPAIGSFLGRRAGAALDPHLETEADRAGAAMTRYPPGLAAALGRLAERSTTIDAVAPTAAHLWLADPLPEAVPEPFVPHPPLADRIEVLHEL
jgi:heat shock protein HtpX